MKQSNIEMFFGYEKPKHDNIVTNVDLSSPKCDLSTPSSPKVGSSVSDSFVTRVLTPEWHVDDDNNNVSVFPRYDPVDLHHKLEIIEHRIQSGQDKQRGHPAMCVHVLEHEGVVPQTRSELKMMKNYEVIDPKCVIPSFWERRVYDKESDCLNVDDSNELRATIDRCAVGDGNTSHVVTRRRSWRPHAAQKRKMFGSSSEDIFATEESDDAVKTYTRQRRSARSTERPRLDAYVDDVWVRSSDEVGGMRLEKNVNDDEAGGLFMENVPAVETNQNVMHTRRSARVVEKAKPETRLEEVDGAWMGESEAVVTTESADKPMRTRRSAPEESVPEEAELPSAMNAKDPVYKLRALTRYVSTDDSEDETDFDV